MVNEVTRFYNNSYYPLEYGIVLPSNWTTNTGPDISNWTSATKASNVSFEIATVHYLNGYGATQVITTSNLIAGPFPVITSKLIRVTNPSARRYCTEEQGGLYQEELNGCQVFSLLREFCIQVETQVS